MDPATSLHLLGPNNPTAHPPILQAPQHSPSPHPPISLSLSLFCAEVGVQKQAQKQL